MVAFIGQELRGFVMLFLLVLGFYIIFVLFYETVMFSPVSGEQKINNAL